MSYVALVIVFFVGFIVLCVGAIRSSDREKEGRRVWEEAIDERGKGGLDPIQADYRVEYAKGIIRDARRPMELALVFYVVLLATYFFAGFVA